MFLFVEYIVEQEVWDRRFGLETMSQIIVLFLKLKTNNLLMLLLCPYFISKTIFDKFI